VFICVHLWLLIRSTSALARPTHFFHFSVTSSLVAAHGRAISNIHGWQFFVLFVSFVALFLGGPKKFNHKEHKEHKGKRKDKSVSYPCVSA